MVQLSSAGRVNEVKQVEKVFEELINKIEDADFDLPPALKEWKLGYYVPMKRNVYLTKRRIEDDGIFCSCTPSSGSPVACGKDCQCGMLFSCCSSDCKCGNTCANKSFQHRPLKQTRLITTEKCGSGLVAEDEIKEGEFVIEYVGEVIDDRTCEERLWKMRRQGHTNFYLCEVSSNMIIDATNKGNMSRFINHSCEPNTEMQKWSVIICLCWQPDSADLSWKWPIGSFLPLLIAATVNKHGFTSPSSCDVLLLWSRLERQTRCRSMLRCGCIRAAPRALWLFSLLGLDKLASAAGHRVHLQRSNI